MVTGFIFINLTFACWESPLNPSHFDLVASDAIKKYCQKVRIREYNFFEHVFVSMSKIA